MAILKLIGFGATMVGLAGIAENQVNHKQFSVSLAVLLTGIIILGIDSLVEDIRIGKANSYKKAKKKIDSKCTYIGTTASYPSYLRAGRQ